MGLKRAVLIALALSYPALFIDAWIGHEYTGAGLVEPPQWFPLVFSPIAFVALLVAAFVQREALYRWLTRLTGIASALLGTVGVILHFLPVAKELSEAEEAVTFDAMMNAFGDGPPLLAPGAFAAVGLLVWALGARGLNLSWGPAREAEAPSPLPTPHSGRV